MEFCQNPLPYPSFAQIRQNQIWWLKSIRRRIKFDHFWHLLESFRLKRKLFSGSFPDLRTIKLLEKNEIISYYYFYYFIANQNNENYLRDRVVKALPWANKSYLLVDTLLLPVGRYAMLLLVRRYEDFYPCVFAITPTSNQHLGKLLVNNWDCTRNYRNWLENV